jgi:hypothetical protein
MILFLRVVEERVSVIANKLQGFLLDFSAGDGKDPHFQNLALSPCDLHQLGDDRRLVDLELSVGELGGELSVVVFH